MIVKLWDKSELVISREAAERLEAELQKPQAEQMRFIKLNGELIALAAIAAVRKGGMTEADVPRLAARTPGERTPEELAKARQKIAKMRADFLAKRAKS